MFILSGVNCCDDGGCVTCVFDECSGVEFVCAVIDDDGVGIGVECDDDGVCIISTIH